MNSFFKRLLVLLLVPCLLANVGGGTVGAGLCACPKLSPNAGGGHGNPPPPYFAEQAFAPAAAHEEHAFSKAGPEVAEVEALSLRETWPFAAIQLNRRQWTEATVIGGGQKPFGSLLTPTEQHSMLSGARSQILQPREVGRWLRSLKKSGQSDAGAFKRAFPLFGDELKVVKQIPFCESFDQVVKLLAQLYGMKPVDVHAAMPFDGIVYRELQQIPIDPTTGAPLAGGAFVEAGKLVVYISPGNTVGVFHEIYQHIVLAPRKDLSERDRHTAATLAETAFINRDAGLITPRDEEQLRDMLRYKKANPLERLFSEYPTVKSQIADAKFRRHTGLRNYAIRKAAALHDEIRAQRDARLEQDLATVVTGVTEEESLALRNIVKQIRIIMAQSGYYARILIEMIARGDPSFMANPDLGNRTLGPKELAVFCDYIKDDMKAGLAMAKLQSSRKDGLTAAIHRLLKTRGEEESYLEILLYLANEFMRPKITAAHLPDDALLEERATLLDFATLQLVQVVKYGRQQYADAEQKALEAQYRQAAVTFSKGELSRLLESLTGLTVDKPMSMQQILDRQEWESTLDYLGSLESLNQWLIGAYHDIRAIIVERQDSNKLNTEAAQLLNSGDRQRLMGLPLDPGWPTGHGNLWRRALLVDTRNARLIRHYLRNGDGMNFLTSRASILAVFLSARLTRPAAQAFLQAFDPGGRPNKIFDRYNKDDRRIAFFWYYLSPVYEELTENRKIPPELAGRCLADWSGRLHDPRLWVPKNIGVAFNMADWLDENFPSLDRHINKAFVQRIANILAPDSATPPHDSARRDTFGVLTGDFGNPYRMLPIDVMGKEITKDNISRLKTRLKDKRLFYRVTNAHLKGMIANKMKLQFSERADKAYRGSRGKLYVLGAIDDAGTLGVRLEDEAVQAWVYKTGAVVAGSKDFAGQPEGQKLEDNIEIVLRMMGWQTRRFKEEFPDLVIELREHHDYMGEADLRMEFHDKAKLPPTVIIPRQALVDVQLLQGILIEELRHVLTGEPDEKNTPAATRIWLQVTNVYAVKSALKRVTVVLDNALDFDGVFERVKQAYHARFGGDSFDGIRGNSHPEALPLFDQLADGIAGLLLAQKRDRRRMVSGLPLKGAA